MFDLRKHFNGMKREYAKLFVTPLEVSPRESLLASSIIATGHIQSVGQEVGITYNLSADDGIDQATGKTFSHEWEAGGPTE